MTLREQLLELTEPKYMKFTSALMPGVENVLGIRLPVLRSIAKEIAAGDWRAYLAEAEDFYFEERMLQGLVIGYARCEPAEKLAHVARFVPKIDNWAVCDCFCWRLRAAERQPMWEFIQPYFHAQAEYDVRFAVVMGLGNFVDEQHLEAFLRQLDGIRHEAYYARMAVAWAVSVCYIKFPQRTRLAGKLLAGRLDLQQIAAENHRVLPRERRREAGNPGDETPPVKSVRGSRTKRRKYPPSPQKKSRGGAFLQNNATFV